MPGLSAIRRPPGYTKAEALNNPFFAFNTSKHAGELGREYSVGVVCDTPGVEIRAVKKAEDGDMYIVRLYETSGKEIKNGEIRFAGDIAGAWELNGIEEIKGEAAFSGNSITFSTTAFRPKTFGVKFSARNHAHKPATRKVELDFNAMAFAPDAYGTPRTMPGFDGKNCYSWDLLPDTLYSEGVPFTFGSLEDNNVMYAEGQSLAIDNDGTYKTLYLLCSSREGDHRATFLVDGKPFEAAVPFWSGEFGQWGWDGGKNFVKEASPAYVATHIQNRATTGEPYVLGYMYKIAVPISADTKSVIVPKTKQVAIFAAALSGEDFYGTTPADEFRAL